MKIVVAPDSFKECLAASDVAGALASALDQLRPGWEVLSLPLADGGEGTLAVLAKALGASVLSARVHDPLGRPVQAAYAKARDLAVVEVAEACGLSLLQPGERNPLIASSQGVGELLMAAYEAGCRHFIVGLGGTATCDGGAGMLSVPGVKEALKTCTVELLCDVDVPLLGPHGAAKAFAPQKGASEKDVEELEQKMQTLAAEWLLETGINVADTPGAGAAGGLGAAFLSHSKARCLPGCSRILELCGFSQALEGADLVITGEGRSDFQTLMGKVPYTVLRHAGTVPVALLSGKIEDRPALEQAGFNPIIEVTPRHLPRQEALKPEVAKHYLEAAVQTLLSTAWHSTKTAQNV